MLTDNPLTEVPDLARDAGGPGERLRRLERRRRLVKEEVLAVAVLLVLLAATVVVLATQWLASGPSANASGVPSVHVVYLDTGGTT